MYFAAQRVSFRGVSFRAGLAAIAVAVMMTTLPFPALGAGPKDGLIVFTSDRDGLFEIYVMNADGSNQTRLTSNSFFAFGPRCSPDASRILFTSSRGMAFDVYVMDADGSNQIQLTSDPSSDSSPDWSPDGSKIAFQSTRRGNYEIYVMDADGANQTSVTT